MTEVKNSPNYQFRHAHLRNRKARLAKTLDGFLVKTVFLVAAIASPMLGAALVYLRSPLAWAYFAFSSLLWIILYWHKKALKPLPNLTGDDINNILSFELASRLPKDPTPKDLIAISAQTKSGIFLINRYMIFPEYLNAIVESSAPKTEKIFELALKIREKTNSEHITGAILMLAVVESFPGADNLLKKLKLDLDDLYDGIDWFNYIHGLVKGRKKARRTGGIGRDLSFGYTPLLQHFAANISQNILAAHVYVNQASSDEVLAEMIKTFSTGGRQNIALVGEEGSGRKTIVYSFATKLLLADSKLPSKLQYSQVFKLDAASLISAANERGALENLMLRLLDEVYRAKNIILWLDNAQLFFEEGTGSVDLSKILLPVIQGGKLRIILTMEQQRYLEIEAKNSLLSNALNKVLVPPSTKEESLDIMQDRVPFLEHAHGVVYTIWALKESYRLSEKYIHKMAMPGRALKLLEDSAAYAEQGLVTAASVQTAIEKTYGVRMASSQDEASRQDLLDMEALIHKRMVGQELAVKAVAAALRRSAAGVRNENRPIGTFLFLGPTGVGKTELAKTISEVYFHGEGAIIRLDLNEFVEESSVNRLIADATVDECSLTAQITSHPFSVVLLDEIEKAHPKVLTALLQLLDEGILRDSKNQNLSFRDAIIVATSNAGADKIRSLIDQNANLETLKDEITTTLIDSGEFKAEFLNRFDEICIFQPLSKAELSQIFELILKNINQTMQEQKITVTVDDDARAEIIEKGYDPKLGARPLRRVAQNTIENIVAKAILRGDISAGDSINITANTLKEEN